MQCDCCSSQCDCCSRQRESDLPHSERVAQALLLAVLFAVPALLCLYAAIVNDPDVWWHLRAGEWMMQHHAVPQSDPFSVAGAGKPWVSYSWLYELIVVHLFSAWACWAS